MKIKYMIFSKTGIIKENEDFGALGGECSVDDELRFEFDFAQNAPNTSLCAVFEAGSFSLYREIEYGQAVSLCSLPAASLPRGILSVSIKKVGDNSVEAIECMKLFIRRMGDCVFIMPKADFYSMLYEAVSENSALHTRLSLLEARLERAEKILKKYDGSDLFK